MWLTSNICFYTYKPAIISSDTVNVNPNSNISPIPYICRHGDRWSGSFSRALLFELCAGSLFQILSSKERHFVAAASPLSEFPNTDASSFVRKFFPLLFSGGSAFFNNPLCWNFSIFLLLCPSSFFAAFANKKRPSGNLYSWKALKMLAFSGPFKEYAPFPAVQKYKCLF